MEIIHQTATSLSSLPHAMRDANAGLRQQLSGCTGDVQKLSISHSSGMAATGEYFVTIIATIPAKTPEPGIGSMF